MLADRFEGHGPVLVDPVHLFMGDDGAFQEAGTDRAVVMGVQKDHLLRDLFAGSCRDAPQTGMFGQQRSIDINHTVMLNDRPQRHADVFGFDDDVFGNLFHSDNSIRHSH